MTFEGGKDVQVRAYARGPVGGERQILAVDRHHRRPTVPWQDRAIMADYGAWRRPRDSQLPDLDAIDARFAQLGLFPDGPFGPNAAPLPVAAERMAFGRMREVLQGD